ncbi:hypothetical protein V1264_002883 [Littorina saxatilis]
MLKRNGKWEDFLTKLGDCHDDYERLQVVLGTEEVISHLPSQVEKRCKNLEQAESLRAKGNECFKSAKYAKALDYYSQAVRYAPHPSQDDSGSNMLALCFGNRSAAFFHLKQFQCSLTDIDNAIQAGFPAGSLHKLLDRKGKCCLFLKRKQAAIEAFEEAKQVLVADPNIQDKGRQDLIRLTDQFINKCKSLQGASVENSDTEIHEPLPTLLKRSSQMPCAADFLEIKDEAGRGRGLYASRDIKVGEVLIVEKPYTSIVLSDHHLSHCHHCCSRCFVPQPCAGCVDVVFCSSQCRQAAQDSHAAECQLMDAIHTADVRLGHLAYKMVAKAGYAYLMEQRNVLENLGQVEASMLGCDENGVYDSQNYATMYHLVGHCDKRTVEDMWPRTINAAFMVKCLQQTSFFPQWTEGDQQAAEKRFQDVCYIGSHILRHLMMLPCNAHEVSEMGVNWQEPSQSKTLEIGSAIYPVLSLINHSCDPSVVRHSYDDVCVVRAIRGIAEGEELCDNYGALYPVMDRAARQAHLLKQYYFTCSCQACVNNWPMYMEIPKEVMEFYCDKCRGPVPVPGIQQASKTESMACRDCGQRQNIRSLILKVGKLEQGFQDALFKVIFEMDVEGDTLPKLVQFLRVVDKHLHRPVSCHNDCQEAVKMCYAFKANAFPRKNNRSGAQQR